MRKYSFTSRIVNWWNSLSNRVISASSVNIFEKHFDDHWRNLDVKYNYSGSTYIQTWQSEDTVK